MNVGNAKIACKSLAPDVAYSDNSRFLESFCAHNLDIFSVKSRVIFHDFIRLFRLSRISPQGSSNHQQTMY